MLSANQRYKQSGTSLPFSEWIEREKAKGIVIPQKGVTDVYMKAVQGLEKNDEQNPVSTPPKILGLDKRILIISGVIILSAIAYKYYKDRK